ncbi:MAG: hypothetical protein JO208_10390 [Alphaproteobacteria bacterium]|nr:hypothetical protein [Alphaproteobacteria bacterium]
MTKPEEYRREAADCVRLAHAFDDASTKALLVGMAETWWDLARAAENAQREHRTLGTEAAHTDQRGGALL